MKLNYICPFKRENFHPLRAITDIVFNFKQYLEKQVKDAITKICTNSMYSNQNKMQFHNAHEKKN